MAVHQRRNVFVNGRDAAAAIMLQGRRFRPQSHSKTVVFADASARL